LAEFARNELRFRWEYGFNVDFDGDVSDGAQGGYTCDGCDENVNWNDWHPSRIEINEFQKTVFANEPYHISEIKKPIITFSC
jgi:hypothetical protein